MIISILLEAVSNGIIENDTDVIRCALRSDFVAKRIIPYMAKLGETFEFDTDDAVCWVVIDKKTYEMRLSFYGDSGKFCTKALGYDNNNLNYRRMIDEIVLISK